MSEVIDVLTALAAASSSVAAKEIAGLVSNYFSRIKALRAADTSEFESVLKNGDLTDLGNIIRNKLGSVSLETLLNDVETQSKVYRSLQRLAEVINQPSPDDSETNQAAEENDWNTNPQDEQHFIRKINEIEYDEKSKSSDFYLDYLDLPKKLYISKEIRRISQRARNEIRSSDIWSGLAGARRSLEITLLPHLGNSRKFLSARIFRDNRLRAAMRTFLSVANKAIHGTEESFEGAERALNALDFIAEHLPVGDL